MVIVVVVVVLEGIAVAVAAVVDLDVFIVFCRRRRRCRCSNSRLTFTWIILIKFLAPKVDLNSFIPSFNIAFHSINISRIFGISEPLLKYL